MEFQVGDIVVRHWIADSGRRPEGEHLEKAEVRLELDLDLGLGLGMGLDWLQERSSGVRIHSLVT